MTQTLTLRALAARVDAGDEPLLTIKEVAELTNCNLHTVRGWIYTYHSLATVPYGPSRRPRIRGRDLIRFFGDRTEEGPRPDRPGDDPCVYFIAAGEWVKIGASRRLSFRFEDLQAASPLPLTLLAWYPTETVRDALALEHQLHTRFAALRHHHEWFRLTAEIQQYIHEHNVSDPVPPRYLTDPCEWFSCSAS